MSKYYSIIAYKIKRENLTNYLSIIRVIESRNGRFPKGTLLLAKAGWQSHFISKGENVAWIQFDRGSSPVSYLLGTLGLPG